LAKILIVEDNATLRDMVSDLLEADHHHIETVTNGSDAEAQLLAYKFDLIVLDWNLPDVTGVEIAQAFRAKGGTTPILMLTARQTIDDKEEGLESGADDYLTKPFEPRELVARVRSLLRRPAAYTGSVLRVGCLQLDPIRFIVLKNNKPINLTQLEFKLLEFFMRQPDSFFTTDALIDRVWASSSDATAASIRTCVKNLRKKIDDETGPSAIQNVPNVGYKIDSSVLSKADI
jgi:DNA-binding response OmpR family regulator